MKTYEVHPMEDGTFSIFLGKQEVPFYPNQKPVHYKDRSECEKDVSRLMERDAAREAYSKACHAFPRTLDGILRGIHAEPYLLRGQQLRACWIADCRPKEEARMGSRPHPFGVLSCDPLDKPYVDANGDIYPVQFLASPKDLWIELPKPTPDCIERLNRTGLLHSDQLQRFQKMEYLFFCGPEKAERNAEEAFSRSFLQHAPSRSGWFQRLDEPKHFEAVTHRTFTDMLKQGFSPEESLDAMVKLSPMIFPARTKELYRSLPARKAAARIFRDARTNIEAEGYFR